MIIPLKDEMDLEATLDGGQSFRWSSKDLEWWSGYIENNPIKIRSVLEKQQMNIEVDLNYVDIPIEMDSVTKYLNIGFDVGEMNKRLMEYREFRPYLKAMPKFRLLKQDPWETLISFMLSAQSNIPKIKKNIQSLSYESNNIVTSYGNVFYKFPTAERIYDVGEKKLRDLGMGFRSKNVYTVAGIVMRSEIDLYSLDGMDYSNAREILMELPGVGPKIADCVLAFSLDHQTAFPVDRWVARGINSMYPQTVDFTLDKLSQWGRDKFGSSASYAQQIFFHTQRWGL